MEIDPQTAEWIAGSVFIGLYGYKRYNTSRFVGIAENRNSTTFLRFSAYFLCYLLTLLAIYWVFGSLLQTSPEVVARFLPVSGGPSAAVSPGFDARDLAHLTGPIVSALMLTTLLPSLPILQAFDLWLLKRFWDLGRIPNHVLRQSGILERAPLTIRPGIEAEIIGRAERYKIPRECVDFEVPRSIEGQWTGLCYLMLKLGDWKDHGGKYARFLQENESEFIGLTFEFDTISSHFSDYQHRRKSTEANRDVQSQEILDDLGKRLKEEIEGHYKKICTFISCGVFAAELTETARRKSFKELGFDQDAVVVESLKPDQVATLALSIALAFVGISIVEAYLTRPEGIRLGPILFLSVIMTASYGAAAIAAILPRAVWSFADIDQTGARSFLAYVFATVLAVFFGLVAMISIRYTFGAFEGLDPERNVDKVIENLSWSYPYLVQSAAIAFATAFLADSFRSRPGAGRSWFRWADVIWLGLAMMAATFVVYCWLEGIGPFEATRDLRYRGQTNPYLFVAKGTIVGLVIGYLVPSWYRKNRRRTPMERLTQLLNSQGSDLAFEAGQLQKGELLDAVGTVAAYVASADGKIDSIEQETLGQFYYKLKAVQAVGFELGDVNMLFADLAEQFQLKGKRDDETALGALRPVRGRVLLAEALVYLGLAIGHADHFFADKERIAITSIIEQLKLDSKNYDLFTKKA